MLLPPGFVETNISGLRIEVLIALAPEKRGNLLPAYPQLPCLSKLGKILEPLDMVLYREPQPGKSSFCVSPKQTHTHTRPDTTQPRSSTVGAIKLGHAETMSRTPSTDAEPPSEAGLKGRNMLAALLCLAGSQQGMRQCPLQTIPYNFLKGNPQIH